MDSLYLMDDGTCFSLSPSKKNKKVLNVLERKEIFKNLNIDYKLISEFTKDLKERQIRKESYKNEDSAILSFLNSSNDNKQKNRTKLKR